VKKQHKSPWCDDDKDGRQPLWMQHGPPSQQHKPGCLFVRFLLVFGLMVMLVVAGMAFLALTITRLVGDGGAGSRETAVFVLIGSCGLAIFLPLLGLAIAGFAFRGIAMPLSDVMEAADKVAEGDFTVRVDEHGRRNQFAQLARSFNRMTVELQRADQQRRNLTADVAHELRTPLHIIQGNLEGILDGVYPPDADHIEATLEETRTLARLVNDLHTLSQAEAGQLPLTIEPVDITDLLADIQTSFSGQAEAKNIQLTVAFDGKPADLTVTGDAGRLDQVLSNLVMNAIRHTPAGGEIRLHARRENGRVIITVQDNGAGIPKEDLPYIFNRFWRGDKSRTHTDGAGGGLGLAIAKQLVEAHRGSIDVTSTLAQGTCFTLSLPAA
jgi:two-component system OmpR family sensor kinase/two-component system sensor histidine kinase BaeS